MGGTHFGLFSPETCSDVNAFVGESPLRYEFPILWSFGIFLFSICHFPPQAWLQNLAVNALYGFTVNSPPQISHALIAIDDYPSY